MDARADGDGGRAPHRPREIGPAPTDDRTGTLIQSALAAIAALVALRLLLRIVRRS
ncbi:MAG: hypothetical protein AAGF02_14795 [Actinomycetota bacterium]